MQMAGDARSVRIHRNPSERTCEPTRVSTAHSIHALKCAGVRAHLCVNVPKLGGASKHFERRNELTAINARLSAAALRRT
jgi:hypothetical protein